MNIVKSALSSILVLLGGCDRTPVPDGPKPAVQAEAAPRAAEPSQTAPSASTPGPSRPSPPSVAPQKEPAKTVYVCPMHPEVVSENPGLCPKCNMRLDPKPQVRSSVESTAALSNWA